VDRPIPNRSAGAEPVHWLCRDALVHPHKTTFYGYVDSFCSASYIEFFQDVCDMNFQSGLANIERPDRSPYCSCRQTLLVTLLFPDRSVRNRPCTSPVLFRPWRYPCVTAADRFDALNDLVDSRVFYQIAVSAGAQYTVDVFFALECRDDSNFGSRFTFANRKHGLDAVQHRHTKVDQSYIRLR